MTEKLAPRSAREPQGTAVGSGSLSTLFRHGHIHDKPMWRGRALFSPFFLPSFQGNFTFQQGLGFRLSLRDARNRLWLSQC